MEYKHITVKQIYKEWYCAVLIDHDERISVGFGSTTHKALQEALIS